MSNILQFVKRDKVAAKSSAVTFNYEDSPYHFEEKPVAKSTTSALIAQPGNISCPNCGHRKVFSNNNCSCSCHQSWNPKTELR